ncbi:metal-sensing transcriptional repressor [Cupriavidus metallidurans]|uniref:metal-sensing transcriptional repressor n=1 Tax=Cupriavidus metallidurans TaxID=119219 RepID=UPI0035C67C51
MSHANDPELLKRLRRAEGHLAAVVAMVGNGRDGLDIAQQLQAVIKALEKSKQLLILDHIDHHLVEAAGALPEEVRTQLSGLREITKYL